MEIEFSPQAYHYDYEYLMSRIYHLGKELNKYLSGRCYITDMELEKVIFTFLNTECFKCRVRPQYKPIHNITKASQDAFVMVLSFEIPMPQTESSKVSREDTPTYIGKALMKVLESQNVPTKIRKQFDRERFIADVRDFFVNVKGCKLD